MNNSNISSSTVGTASHDYSHDSLVYAEGGGAAAEKERWDFVIAYPAIGSDSEQEANKVELRNHIQEELQRVGLTVSKVDAKDGKQIFLLIRASDDLLEEHAELLAMQLPLKDSLHGGFCPFTLQTKELFQRQDDGHLFTKTQKQFLIQNIITGDDDDGAAELDLEKLVYDGVISKAYPLHEYKKAQTIINEWVFKFAWRSFRELPIVTLRNYFGEEIAFYYGWLEFYTKYLWVASIVGLIAFILGYSGISNENKWANTIYSIFIAIWVTAFLEGWKRQRSVLAWQWNMLTFEEAEGTRPGFVGEEKQGVYVQGEFIEILPEDEIYGITTPKLTKWFPSHLIHRKMMAALGLIALLCAVVVMATMSVLTFRLFVQSRTSVDSLAPSFVGGILNAIVIQLLNKIYRYVAVKMNEWENHRTTTDFHDNLLFKIFLFQFVNSYTSLYYIAFFKKHSVLWGDSEFIDSCGDSSDDKETEFGWGCPNQLQIQLLTLLGTNIVVGQAQEVLIPWALAKAKLYYFTYKMKTTEKEVSKYEREFYLNAHEGTFDEYSEMVIQYGYITLFAAAFPLAPLLAALNNTVEIRSDTWKWLTSYNKIVPRGAADIGAWYTILEVIGIISVITNSLLIAFSFPTLYAITKSPYTTLIIVVILEHAIIVAKYIIALLVPDMPSKVRRVLAKQYYVQQQIVKKYERKKTLKRPRKRTQAPQPDGSSSSSSGSQNAPYQATPGSPPRATGIVV